MKIVNYYDPNDYQDDGVHYGRPFWLGQGEEWTEDPQ